MFHLHRRHYRPDNRPLRACHPRDLLDQVTALCRYRGIEPAVTRELLDAACEAYFVGREPGDEKPLSVAGCQLSDSSRTKVRLQL